MVGDGSWSRCFSDLEGTVRPTTLKFRVAVCKYLNLSRWNRAQINVRIV